MNNTNIITDSQSHLFLPSSSSSPIPVTSLCHQNPRKKRSKLIKIEPTLVPTTSAASAINPRPRYYSKKPDPSAPKITKPCSECGKKFWSWKALFGHMRCHPERQWRGINPPPNHRRPVLPVRPLSNDAEGWGALMTAEDHEVASYLLMLANSEGGATTLPEIPEIADSGAAACGGTTSSPMVIDDDQANCTRFECSSCKKVFGSHQALGGHRASHKNVKGCFAIKRSDTDGCEVADQEYPQHQIGSGNPVGKENVEEEVNVNKMVMVLGHRCGICSRVFSSGQALGGHKRCHWEKGEEASSSMHQGPKESCAFDLNLPAPPEDGSSSSYSSGLTLDLRLGL